MEPIVNGLEEEFSAQIVFERHNAITSEAKAVMTAFGLRGHPSYVIVTPDGDRLWSFAGFIEEESLRSQLVQASKPAQ